MGGGAAAPGAGCRPICPLGPHPGDLAAGGAGRRGQKPDPQRRYHRQSVCANPGNRGPRGYDAGKQVTGRKRHILVDTLGRLWTVGVHSADKQDRDGAKLVLPRLQARTAPLQLIGADAGSAGPLIEGARTGSGGTLDIVKRPPSPSV